MVEPAFDPAYVKRECQKLTREGRLAFALSCAERTYPNYITFAHEHKWGNPDAIRRALDIAWDSLEGTHHDAKEIESARIAVRQVEPDTDDFESAYVSPALDAAVIAEVVLSLLEQDDVELISQIASLCRDSVDMYVQSTGMIAPSSLDREVQIIHHPLMQHELRRQREELSRLASLDWSPATIKQLTAEWRNTKRSNIGLVASWPYG